MIMNNNIVFVVRYDILYDTQLVFLSRETLLLSAVISCFACMLVRVRRYSKYANISIVTGSYVE